MQAVYYEQFQQPLTLRTLPDPTPTADGVVIDVKATGVCRSDWHGWMGHDPDITLPHVPGHELAGTIAAVGRDVTRWQVGQRVTVPFVGGCGTCPSCHAGQQQICDTQFQPGFTHWGSFADYVAIGRADLNLVELPEQIDFTTAASLGCRFITSYRAIVDQGRTKPGQWVAIHGCGGVGLSAIMIATAIGAHVIAIDIAPDKLELATQLGAVATVNGQTTADVPQAIAELTQGGAHVSIDALGHPTTCYNSIACLRKQGKHIQVGLIAEGDPPIPMGKVIAHELEILGSHGMQAHRYPDMMAMILAGKLQPEKLVGRTLSLADAPQELMNMHKFTGTGIAVINQF